MHITYLIIHALGLVGGIWFIAEKYLHYIQFTKTVPKENRRKGRS